MSTHAGGSAPPGPMCMRVAPAIPSGSDDDEIAAESSDDSAAPPL